MAISAGSVSIADNGTETKSGMAQAIYDQRLAAFNTAKATALAANPYSQQPSLEQTVDAKRAIASAANADATAIVTYLLANLKAVITTSDAALQQAGGVDTTAPTAKRLLGVE